MTDLSDNHQQVCLSKYHCTKVYLLLN